MLTVEEWMDVKQLFNEGHSRRAIARMTGYSRNTVDKLLLQPAPRPFQAPPRAFDPRSKVSVNASSVLWTVFAVAAVAGATFAIVWFA